MKSKKSKRAITLLIHLISWIIVFAFPLIFSDRSGEKPDWTGYLLHTLIPFVLLILFYLNTGVLLPRLLFAKKTWKFFTINILLVLVLSIGINSWQKKVIVPYMQRTVYEYRDNTLAGAGTADPAASGTGSRQGFRTDERQPDRLQSGIRRKPGPPRMPGWAFYLRDALTMAFVIGLAATIKMSQRWSRAEESLRIAQEKQTEAELNNLRNQLNPHFLLNTLNNIYALIALDTGKAQEAVHRLSKLLRYLLYENQEITVPLVKEAGFLKNYVELMKIRLRPGCEIRTEINISPDSATQIAPLLLISLIENAFKHGVSAAGPCFIHLKLEEITGCLEGKSGALKNIIVYTIENSYYPKDKEDKSGSGIGLNQVQTRLDLLYKDHYKWEYGPLEKDGAPVPGVYRSCLELETS